MKINIDKINKMCREYICPLTSSSCTGNRCPCLEIDQTYNCNEITVYCECYSLFGIQGRELGVVIDEGGAYLHDDFMMKLP